VARVVRGVRVVGCACTVAVFGVASAAFCPLTATAFLSPR